MRPELNDPEFLKSLSRYAKSESVEFELYSWDYNTNHYVALTLGNPGTEFALRQMAKITPSVEIKPPVYSGPKRSYIMTIPDLLGMFDTFGEMFHWPELKQDPTGLIYYEVKSLMEHGTYRDITDDEIRAVIGKLDDFIDGVAALGQSLNAQDSTP